MAGPFDLERYLSRMAELGRDEILAATVAEISRYDAMQRQVKGAMRAATREHRQRLAAFLDFIRHLPASSKDNPDLPTYARVVEMLVERGRRRRLLSSFSGNLRRRDRCRCRELYQRSMVWMICLDQIGTGSNVGPRLQLRGGSVKPTRDGSW